jgi:hypothetical protein
MNTETFTPGNWRRAMNKSRNGKTVRGLSNCRIENKNGVVIAFTVPQKSRQEQVANTNLLATAPEMYEMLNEVASDITLAMASYPGIEDEIWQEILKEDVQKIIKLLKKARGEE